ncbi:MAG: hypothetical protein AB1458_12810 [Bacteroidota bacterium]
MRKKAVLILYTAAASLFSSCGDNPLLIDVSQVQVPQVTIRRFDRELFSVNAGNFEERNAALKAAYGEYYEGFVQTLIWRKGIADSLYKEKLLEWLGNQYMRSLYDECQKVYPDLGDVENDLRSAFRYFRHYFPGRKLPVPVATMTGFYSSLSYADSLYCVGLDMYLGEGSRFYEYAQFPYYKRKTMNRYNLVPDFIRGWMMNEFPDKSQKNDLLSQIVYQGKIMYLLDAFLPEAEDSVKIAFTGKQLGWCEANEKNIWGYMIENEMLYSTSAEVIAKFVNEGPFTSGFVKESPARTGIWIGWQMVRAYMKKTKKTLPQLMAEPDARKILDESKYKPN